MVSSGRVDDIVVGVPVDHLEEMRGQLGRVDTPLVVVAGGRRRQDSVANALVRVPRESDVVMIHDAACDVVMPTVIPVMPERNM